MQYIFRVIALFFFYGILVIQIQGQSQSLKVITYNILNGFDWGKDTVREKNLGAWLNDQQADVVALQELCGFNQEKLSTFAKAWGHDYAVILKTSGYPVGITSNQPIKIKEKLLDSLWHGMLHCETQGVDFFVVHLSPADWAFRRKEAEIISARIKDNMAETSKYIVLGDFNAHSPLDADFDLMFPYQLERSRASDAKNEKYKNLRDGYFDYSVMAHFLAMPLMDATHRFVPIEERSSFPAPINVGKWMTADEMPKTKCRIDFIMLSPELYKKCTGSQIHNGQANHYLSDHYPVHAVFEW